MSEIFLGIATRQLALFVLSQREADRPLLTTHNARKLSE